MKKLSENKNQADKKMVKNSKASKKLSEALLQKINVPKKPPTKRELEVLELLAEGLSTEECAEIMGISSTTVREYERRLREALRAPNRLNAYKRALDFNFIKR